MNILQKYEKYIYLIILIGFIIYFPIFFNGFVWDDLTYVINNPQMHQFNFSSLLGENIFNAGPFYRPIPAIYFTLLYTHFGSHAFPYHLIQLLLHLTDTVLLFFYFLLFFSDGLAFFLALLFLTHPINVESVAFIGASQSELYFLPGIIALLIGHKKNISRNRIIVISILFLLSILAKETGALFLFILLIYRYLFKLNKIKEIIAVGLFIGAFYFFMRVFIAGVTYSTIGFVQITTVPFIQRLYYIPGIVIYYLETFLFPVRLLIWQMWIINTLSIENFVIPLILCLLFVTLLIYIFFIIHKKEAGKPSHITQLTKKHLAQQLPGLRQRRFLFFFLWYLMGMGLLLQLVPLDMTVADRWFYFPIVGLLGMIGVGWEIYTSSVRQHQKYYLYGAIIIISIFSLRTFIRTFDWKNNLVLFSHDIKYENNDYILLNAYATELGKQGKTDEYCFYEKKSVNIFATTSNLNELGDCYILKEQYDDAIATYTEALDRAKTEKDNKQTLLSVYLNKTQALILADRPQDAIDFINNEALKLYPREQHLLQLRAKAQAAIDNDNTLFQMTSPSSTTIQNQKIDNVLNRK